jgi:hypothetical protein
MKIPSVGEFANEKRNLKGETLRCIVVRAMAV